MKYETLHRNESGKNEIDHFHPFIPFMPFMPEKPYSSRENIIRRQCYARPNSVLEIPESFFFIFVNEDDSEL
jgi:hypothetical protein